MWHLHVTCIYWLLGGGVAALVSSIPIQANKMAIVIEIYSKYEFRTLVRFLEAEGVSQGVIHQRLVSVYGYSVCSQKEVSVWFSTA
jgi:hypothetical protein